MKEKKKKKREMMQIGRPRGSRNLHRRLMLGVAEEERGCCLRLNIIKLGGKGRTRTGFPYAALLRSISKQGKLARLRTSSVVKSPPESHSNLQFFPNQGLITTRSHPTPPLDLFFSAQASVWLGD
jgi:hypothetical protein